jgi:branched-chain amino acid transport system ATP-binding protein
MCAIGRGLMARPRLLMIDELSLGLAPVAVDMLVDALHALNARGTALLVVEQDLQVALELAGRGYVLEHGHMVKDGPATALLADPEVRSTYLGV